MTDPLSPLSQAEAEIVRAFSRANAVSPNTATPLEDLAISDDAAFASLLARGIVCASPHDRNKFYVPPRAPSVFASRDQRGTVVAALRAVIVIAIGVFVWRMIDLL